MTTGGDGDATPAVPTDPEDDGRDDPRLNAFERVGAAVVGVLGFGFGTLAVFTRDVEAGPVALIAVGLIGALIAVGGRLPSRLKFGDNEATWRGERRAGQVIANIIEQSPQGDRQEQIAELEELAKRAPAAAGPGLRAIAFEQRVLSELTSRCNAIERQYGVHITLAIGHQAHIAKDASARFDLQISTKEKSETILVEAISQNDRGKIFKAATNLMLAVTSDPDCSGLIVTPTYLSALSSATAMPSTRGKIAFVPIDQDHNETESILALKLGLTSTDAQASNQL